MLALFPAIAPTRYFRWKEMIARDRLKQHNGADVAEVQEFPLAIIPERPQKRSYIKKTPMAGVSPQIPAVTASHGPTGDGIPSSLQAAPQGRDPGIELATLLLTVLDRVLKR
jgi:hypothetical protein